MNILNSADTAATINLITRNARGTTTTSDGATSAGLTAKENLSHLISGGFDMPRPTSIFEGVPPFSFISNGDPLVNWIIYGNTGGVGEKTENLWNNQFTAGYQLSTITGLPVEYTTNNSRMAMLTPIDVSSNNSVTFNFTNLTPSAFSVMYSILDDNETLIERVAGKTVPFTIDTTNATKLYIAVYRASGTDDISENMITNIMLNNGATAATYEPYGYKIPVICGGVTTNIYIDEPLTAGETITYNETGVIIPTRTFLNTLSVGTTVQPAKVFIEYVK